LYLPDTIDLSIWELAYPRRLGTKQSKWQPARKVEILGKIFSKQQIVSPLRIAKTLCPRYSMCCKDTRST